MHILKKERKMSQSLGLILFSLLVFYGFHLFLWSQTKTFENLPENIPQAPGQAFSRVFAFGDAQLAYRLNGFQLQNFGNIGGEARAIRDYDFQKLKDWFFLQDYLDPFSNFTPALAAYVFGATDDAQDVPYVIDYLSIIGQRAEGFKWRWLAHAVYMARYQEENIPKAIALAELLAQTAPDHAPFWARQMHAYIEKDRGNKQAAYDIMVGVLKAGQDDLHPNEINNMIYYICNVLLDAGEAAQDPLCQK